MIEIDDKVISLDIIENQFCCDLNICHGVCCVHGESGAPVEEEEVDLLRDEYPAFKSFLRPEGIKAVDEQGVAILDADQEMVTPLIDGKECAYAIFEQGITRCGIEKAFEAGKTSMHKPISCHLYPIRVKRYRDFKAVNYDRWPICEPARGNGKEHDVPVFRFVRDALIRKFGPEFYQKLEILSDSIDQKSNE